MKTIGSTIIMLALASSLFADNGKELKLASPDGTHEIVFYQKQVSPAVNELCYRVDYKSQPVVNESRAGLELDNRNWEIAMGVRNLKQHACWMDNLEVDYVPFLSLLDRHSGRFLRYVSALNTLHLSAALR